ncbi:MAG: hypothetical protein AAF770_00860 [Bacteroidota bacterium]
MYCFFRNLLLTLLSRLFFLPVILYSIKSTDYTPSSGSVQVASIGVTYSSKESSSHQSSEPHKSLTPTTLSGLNDLNNSVDEGSNKKSREFDIESLLREQSKPNKCYACCCTKIFGKVITLFSDCCKKSLSFCCCFSKPSEDKTIDIKIMNKLEQNAKQHSNLREFTTDDVIAFQKEIIKPIIAASQKANREKMESMTKKINQIIKVVNGLKKNEESRHSLIKYPKFNLSNQISFIPEHSLPLDTEYENNHPYNRYPPGLNIINENQITSLRIKACDSFRSNSNARESMASITIATPDCQLGDDSLGIIETSPFPPSDEDNEKVSTLRPAPAASQSKQANDTYSI